MKSIHSRSQGGGRYEQSVLEGMIKKKVQAITADGRVFVGKNFK